MASQQHSTRVSLQGSATLRRAAELYAALQPAVMGQADLVLDVAQLSEVDLSFLQMLLAAGRSLAARGWRLQLVPEHLPEPFVQALQRGGFGLGSDPARWIVADSAAQGAA